MLDRPLEFSVWGDDFLEMDSNDSTTFIISVLVNGSATNDLHSMLKNDGRDDTSHVSEHHSSQHKNSDLHCTSNQIFSRETVSHSTEVSRNCLSQISQNSSV